jgi:hypothetical protein
MSKRAARTIEALERGLIRRLEVEADALHEYGSPEVKGHAEETRLAEIESSMRRLIDELKAGG